MKLSLTNTLILASAFVMLAGAFLLYSARADKAEASTYTATVINTATTTTSVAVSGAGSTRILATTTNPTGVPGVTNLTRVYASICNPNAAPVFISLNGDKPTATNVGTAVIAAAAGYSVCYEITDRNQYSGSIMASSSVASTNVSVVEYTQ